MHQSAVAFSPLRNRLATVFTRTVNLPFRLRAAEQALFGDLVGNPLRPPVLDPLWLTCNDYLVPRLAGQLHDERRWDEMPVLGDALEDAGCDDDTILDHCHGPGPHTRGCWLLDLLTGFAREKGATPAQLSLAWMLRKSGSIVPIPGSRRLERIEENFAASGPLVGILAGSNEDLARMLPAEIVKGVLAVCVCGMPDFPRFGTSPGTGDSPGTKI